MTTPDSKIVAVRVQDIARGLWFNYDNGVWDKAPEVKVGANLYIASYAKNEGGTGLMQLLIRDDAETILGFKQQTVTAGSHIGVETGTKNMPNRSYNIKITSEPSDIVTFSIKPVSNGEPPPNGNGEPPTPSACFIATACYGSPTHPKVNELRKTKNRLVAQSKIATYLYKLYYVFSPAVAQKIRNMPRIKAIVRKTIDLLT